MFTLGWGVGVTSELMDHYLSFLNKMFNSLACFQYDIKRKEKHLYLRMRRVLVEGTFLCILVTDLGEDYPSWWCSI